MQQFLRQATTRKIDRLSRLITESFRYLLRKQTLFASICTAALPTWPPRMPSAPSRT